MTLVNDIWYDNELGNVKVWKREGYRHDWGLEPNSDGIQIVKCIKCHVSRMWIGTFENKKCP